MAWNFLRPYAEGYDHAVFSTPEYIPEYLAGRATIIHPGDQLLIPMPRELSDEARKRAERAGRYVPPQGYERVTYKVRKGDTLGAIARRLGVSVSHLKQVNGIKNPRHLQIGQTLAAYRPPTRTS